MKNLSLIIVLLLVGIGGTVPVYAQKKPKPSKTSKLSEKGKRNFYSERRSAFYFGGGFLSSIESGNYFFDNSDNESIHRFETHKLSGLAIGAAITIGNNYKLKSFGEYYLGLSPNISTFGMKAKTLSYLAGIEAPLYLTISKGAGINAENENIWGYALGLGASARYIFTDYEVSHFFYIAPVAMAEVRYRHTTYLYHVRLNADILPFSDKYDGDYGNLQGPKLQFIGLQVLRD